MRSSNPCHLSKFSDTILMDHARKSPLPSIIIFKYAGPRQRGECKMTRARYAHTCISVNRMDLGKTSCKT